MSDYHPADFPDLPDWNKQRNAEQLEKMLLAAKKFSKEFFPNQKENGTKEDNKEGFWIIEMFDDDYRGDYPERILFGPFATQEEAEETIDRILEEGGLDDVNTGVSKFVNPPRTLGFKSLNEYGE